MTAPERATKKQRELLMFIDGFIKAHGFGPSYREIMRALKYKSVSTVAVHVDGLITRGFLRKKDHSARSIVVVSSDITAVKQVETNHLAWLRQEIAARRHLSTGVAAKEADCLEQALNILDRPADKQV